MGVSDRRGQEGDGGVEGVDLQEGEDQPELLVGGRGRWGGKGGGEQWANHI